VTAPLKLILLATSAAVAALAFTAGRAGDAPQVATGFVARVICSETFVSGLDPDRTFVESTDAIPGGRLITWAMDYRVDRAARDVTVTLFGLGRSRAVYRDGLGCTLDHGEKLVDVAVPTSQAPPALLPEIAGVAVVTPQNPQLAAALDRAFAELPGQPPRRTRAIVVVKDGRIIAERYAEGIGIDTQLLGFSVTKSVVSALIGVLVRQGRLKLDGPAPVAAWSKPKDARHTITVEQLLRHTSGLALGSSLQTSLGSTLEPVIRMKYVENDMAAYAEHAPLESEPGSSWNYQDGNTLILSRLIQDTLGGNPDDMLRFARRELFGPLGMRHVTLQVDGTGTIEGSSEMLASARDWARFGQLYVDGGMAGGQRILPVGWVEFSASPTPKAWVGYGAGFWTDRGGSFGATYRIEHGMPREAFFAKGTMGQYVIIVPSERLIVVRLGRSPNLPPEADGVYQLVHDLMAAIRGQHAGLN
jgi:CubicO group peptidase (beta-lactamase class C family)